MFKSITIRCRRKPKVKCLQAINSPKESVEKGVTARESNETGQLYNPINRVDRYCDGKPRPICRGLLHGVVFFIIEIAALPSLLLGIYLGAVSQKYWKLVLFLIGKGFSYGCSAILHLSPFQSTFWLTFALKSDLVAVPISIWANSILLCGAYYDILTILIVGGGFVWLNGVLVQFQFRGHDAGLKTPKGRSDTPRLILIVLQSLGGFCHAGFHYGYRDLWFVTLSLYIVAFAVAIPTTLAHKKEPMCKWFPWHRPGVYGFHEDFHLLLLLADASFMYMGLLLLWNPSNDNYQLYLKNRIL